MCREEFKVPPSGLGGLQHQFFLQRLVDIQKASTEESNEVPCIVCLEESVGGSDKIPSATMYCVDCNQKLCEQCSRPHRRMKGGAHQLRPLGAELKQEAIQLRGGSCDKHNDKQVELYCYDCNENICLMCSAVKHKNHDSGEIPEVAKTFSQQINSDAQKVWSLIHDVEEKTREKEKKRNEFLILADKVKGEIEVAGGQINGIVATQVAKTVYEVEWIKSKEVKEAQTVEDSYQLALVAMKSFHTYSRELLEKGRPSDITRAASELHERATELVKNHADSVQYCPPHLTFTPADVTQVKCLPLIGKVTLAAEKQPGMLQVILFYSI